MTTFKRIAAENTADNELHVFATYMGIPPDSETPPVCGAKLTSAYSGKGKKKCAKCSRMLAAHKRKQGKR